MPASKPYPIVRKEMSIPEHVVLQVELYLKRDPATGKVKFGEWSKLGTRLLQQFLKEKSHESNRPDNS